MDATKQLELLQSFDWTRPIEGNPDEHHVLRVTEDLDVFCNGELEGKIRQFRNGTLSYFGYTLHVDQSQEKVAWTPPPQRNKKEQKATVYWIRTNVLPEQKTGETTHCVTSLTTDAMKTNKAMAEAMIPAMSAPDANAAEPEAGEAGTVEAELPKGTEESGMQADSESEREPKNLDMWAEPEVKPELAEAKAVPARLKIEEAGASTAFVEDEKVFAVLTDGKDWKPGTVSKVAVSESGRVEYTVKWDDSDPELGEESETAGFSANELKPRDACFNHCEHCVKLEDMIYVLRGILLLIRRAIMFLNYVYLNVESRIVYWEAKAGRKELLGSMDAPLIEAGVDALGAAEFCPKVLALGPGPVERHSTAPAGGRACVVEAVEESIV
jgi:hypothetical protein